MTNQLSQQRYYLTCLGASWFVDIPYWPPRGTIPSNMKRTHLAEHDALTSIWNGTMS